MLAPESLWERAPLFLQHLDDLPVLIMGDAGDF